jgi:hypothetical protein
MLSASEELLRPVLNLFAGLFHILSKAVGRVAADGGDGQERGDKERKDETLNRCYLMSFHDVIIEQGTRAGAMGCSPHLRFGSGIIVIIKA